MHFRTIALFGIFLILYRAEQGIFATNRYHLVTLNKKPSKSPYKSFSTMAEQKCFSHCFYDFTCSSFNIEPTSFSNNEIECNFFNTTTTHADYFEEKKNS